MTTYVSVYKYVCLCTNKDQNVIYYHENSCVWVMEFLKMYLKHSVVVQYGLILRKGGKELSFDWLIISFMPPKVKEWDGKKCFQIPNIYISSFGFIKCFFVGGSAHKYSFVRSDRTILFFPGISLEYEETYPPFCLPPLTQ